MWVRSHSKVIKSANKEEIWNRWSDVNSWHEWVPNIEHCRLEKPFQVGSRFILKPKGRAAVIVQLTDVEKEEHFTSCTRFFGAMMYHTYEMRQAPEGIQLTVTLKVAGPLGFLWRILVAEKIANNLPILMRNLTGIVSTPALKKTMPEITPEMNPKVKLTTPEPKNPKLHLIPSPPEKEDRQPSLPGLKKSRLQTVQAEPETAMPHLRQPKPLAVKKPNVKASASALKKGKPLKNKLGAEKPGTEKVTKKSGVSASKKPKL